MFEINDIIQSNINPSIKLLVSGKNEVNYILEYLTGENKKLFVSFHKKDAHKCFKVIAHFKPKELKEVFKPNCFVEVVNSKISENIGKKALFISNVNPPILYNGVWCDCIVKFEGCTKYTLLLKEWIKRIPKPKKQKPKQEKAPKNYTPLLKVYSVGTATVVEKIKSFELKDNIIQILEKEQFDARCHKKDEYDELTGILIALARAYNDEVLEDFALRRDFYNSVSILTKGFKNDK